MPRFVVDSKVKSVEVVEYSYEADAGSGKALPIRWRVTTTQPALSILIKDPPTFKAGAPIKISFEIGEQVHG